MTHSRIVDGIQFKFGPPNQPDAVSGTGQPNMLPMGRYSRLLMLATGVEGTQIVTVTYTIGTTSRFARSFSDWFTPQNFPGEFEAVTMPYRAMADGGLDSRGNFYLYGYHFTLDSSKTVEGFTLPANRDLVVLAVTLTAN